jgi:hypothetical protein
MSDQTDQQNQQQGDPNALGDGGKKALEAERDARKAAERRVSELENQVSTLQASHQQELAAATQATNDAESRAATAEASVLRYKVALEEGVPAKHIGRLQGDTEEALREDAAAFVADIVPGSTTPRPDPSQGSQGTTQKKSTGDQFADFFNENLSV